MRRRRGIAAGLALLALLLGAEAASGWLLWQRGAGAPGSAALALAGRLAAAASRPAAPAACPDHDSVVRQVFAPPGQRTAAAEAVRLEIEARYRAEFDALAALATARGAALLLLYPPMAGAPEPGRGGAVFAAAARDHALPLLRPARPPGLGEADLFLLPVDPHPTRLLHRLMAEALLPPLRDLAGHRARPPAAPAPGARLGALPPGLDTVVATVPAYPYRLRTNAQGLRMEGEVPAEAGRQVVLLLGDSFTYGTPLNAPDLLAAWLAAALPERIIANAGVAGTGITEARAVLARVLAGARADVVVLQLLDNDIEAMLWTAPSSYFMPLPPRPPSAAEARLAASMAAACPG